jgi:hypothetical protein
MENELELIDETRDALVRVQDFDTGQLVREAELGKKFAMREAVAPAKKVIELFKLIAPTQLEFFPNAQLTTIRDQANAFYSLLEEVETFDVEEASPNPSDAKDALVDRLEQQFQPVFNILYPLVSFANIRSLDFAKLERDARAATQTAKDSVAAALSEIEAGKQSVETLVGETRALAAEQGVSKQAIHFKTEADNHKKDATDWQRYTIYTAIGLAGYAVASLFIHKIPGLSPDSSYRAIQIGISKVLIFGVIAYVLILCARNFLSHKHNEIVNRHRQNALATFTALAEATSDAASSDIVLSHAAACIFSPQETGYTKHDSVHAEGVPALQIIPRVGQISGSQG